MSAFNERREARGQGGFTLIELLVVIAILGILAGVVVFAVGGVTGTAKNKSCVTAKATIETAMEAYKADSATSAYPLTLSLLSPASGTKYLKTDPTADFDIDSTDGSVVWPKGSTAAAAGSAGKYSGVTRAQCS